MKRKIVMGLLTLMLLTGCNEAVKPSENTSQPDTTTTESSASTSSSSSVTDYGKLSFGMHQVRVGYSRKITPRFTNEEVGKTEVLHYESSDEAGLRIDEDGTMHGLAVGQKRISMD